jgi:alanyl-tRNA synthetase
MERLAQVLGRIAGHLLVGKLELVSRKSQVVESLTREESRFYETLEKGLDLLDQAFSSLDSSKKIPAAVVFKLYDTFGFPVDLTALIARERGLSIDEAGFEILMSQQQQRSRASWKGSGDSAMPAKVKEWKNQGIRPRFVGYETHTAESKLVAIEAMPDGSAWVAIDPCPFYAESGGQVGDLGALKTSSGQVLEVHDTQKPYDGGYALYLQNAQGLSLGSQVVATASFETRRLTRANHSATHLLHAALRSVLGTHVEQKGSLVAPDRLRFDFSHPKPVSREEIERIEAWVNSGIARQESLVVSHKSYDDAVRGGAMALFGEKYGDEVRVVQMAGLSTELCGGLHVQNTSEIRLFNITSESAVAAGVRRIEALSSDAAIEDFKTKESWLKSMSETLKVVPSQVPERVAKLLDSNRDLERQIQELKRKLASGTLSGDVLEATYRGQQLKIHSFVDVDSDFLKQKGDQLLLKAVPDLRTVAFGVQHICKCIGTTQ